MPQIVIYSIFIVVLILCIAGTYYLAFYKFKHKLENSNKILELQKNKYNDEIEYLNREITRLRYINAENLKFQKLENIPNTPNNLGGQTENAEPLNVAELVSGNEKLEEEKRKFQEKNKKLWEQSIAIHKEKERIDALKHEIELRHKEVTDSIKYAKRIQNALIPSEKHLQQYFTESFVYWQPRDIVSGDFYWVKNYEELTILVVADCTGHGVPGAFMSALGIAFLNQIIAKQSELFAHRVLEDLRELVKTSLKQTDLNSDSKDGMDLALCILNKKKQKLWYAGANNPLFLVRNNELFEYEPVRNPIGIYLKEKQFISIEIDTQENDVFYLFTDGYADEFGGESGKKFKKEKFKQLLVEMNKKQFSLQEQKVVLAETMNNWLGENYKQIDDILVFGFKI